MADGSANFTQKDGANLNVSLRDYVDSRLAAIEKATTVAYDSMNKRLEGMNEFRQSIQDISGKTVTRMEFDQLRERLGGYASCSEVDDLDKRMEELRSQVGSLQETRAELRGKASQQSVMIALGISSIGILLSVLSLLEKLGK